MSKGTPIRSVRIDEQTWRSVHFNVIHRNANSAEEPWTMSDFITVAIREKLAKMERCRRSRRTRRESVTEENGTAVKNELAELALVDTDDAIA